MSKIEDDQYLKRTRATWLAEKLDINFARANAIVKNFMPATPKEKQKISKAIRKEMRADSYKGHKKKNW